MSPMMPPIAPGVAEQMATPVGQYVGGMMGIQDPVQSFNPAQFAMMKMAEVAEALKEAGGILSVHKPALLGILKIMLEAGSTLMSELEADVAVTQPAPGPDGLPPAEAQPQTGLQNISMG